MGLISQLRDALFERKSVIKSDECADRNAYLQDDRWLNLKSPHFFGKARRSSSKRWVVGCYDSDGNGRGGHRDSGNGKVLLVDYESDRIMHELNIFARPMEAAVANNATYIVHDGGFGSDLQGNVVAIDIKGNKVYERHYNANIYNIGLSDCGRYAAVQTANAPNSDGNLFEVLNIERGSSMFSSQPDAGWADQYTFNVSPGGELTSVGVIHKSLGQFFYSGDGEFLDRDAFQNAQLGIGDYWVKIMAARDLLQSDPTHDNAKKALLAVNAALREGAKDVNDWGAQAHRVRGESYELLGQLPEALEAFDQALRLNPKVGIQRRALALRKKIGADL